METTEIKTKVLEIISGMFDLQPGNIPVDKPFPELAKYDSMRALELLAKLETEFSLTIDPDLLQQMYTVEKVTQVVEGLLHAQ
jgi:acyl carrier protein